MNEQSQLHQAPQEPQSFPIGAVAKMTGVPLSTLRYWEKAFAGFLKPPRSARGRRRYDEPSIQMVRRIKELVDDQLYSIVGARTVLQKTGEKQRTGGVGGQDQFLDVAAQVHETVAATLRDDLHLPRALLRKKRMQPDSQMAISRQQRTLVADALDLVAKIGIRLKMAKNHRQRGEPVFTAEDLDGLIKKCAAVQEKLNALLDGS